MDRACDVRAMELRHLQDVQLHYGPALASRPLESRCSFDLRTRYELRPRTFDSNVSRRQLFARRREGRRAPPPAQHVTATTRRAPQAKPELSLPGGGSTPAAQPDRRTRCGGPHSRRHLARGSPTMASRETRRPTIRPHCAPAHSRVALSAKSERNLPPQRPRYAQARRLSRLPPRHHRLFWGLRSAQGSPCFPAQDDRRASSAGRILTSVTT
jgi:hypothetical protein